jgi:hypothetical protein
MRGSLPICSHHHGLIVRTSIDGRTFLHTLFYRITATMRMVLSTTALSITDAYTQFVEN